MASNLEWRNVVDDQDCQGLCLLLSWYEMRQGMTVTMVKVEQEHVAEE